MRGISVLQRAIIRIAYQHRQRVGGSNQADLFFYQFVVEYFWKSTRAEEDKPDPDRQHFKRKRVGRRRYQLKMHSLSRAVTRLEDRGLVWRVKRKGCQWAGLNLTAEGVEVAERGV